ncbi:uncharacterized protein TNCV_972431 [Trichonephila clavipes]|nr:uncharacterized protein TNCV_972431 [Trichonephila clavipes]
MSCDAEDWGFQMLNDDEIVTSVQEESDNDNDETDEDEDNNDESSKGPSNSDAISVLETAMEWYENRERSYSTTVAQENQRPCSEKTEVCNVTAKNKRLFSTIKERQCMQTTIFMQDGSTPHIGRKVKALLSANFSDNHDYPDIVRKHGLLALPT